MNRREMSNLIKLYILPSHLFFVLDLYTQLILTRLLFYVIDLITSYREFSLHRQLRRIRL